MLGVTSNRQTGINRPNPAIGGCIDAANKPFAHGSEAYSTFPTLRLVRWRYKPRGLAHSHGRRAALRKQLGIAVFHMYCMNINNQTLPPHTHHHLLVNKNGRHLTHCHCIPSSQPASLKTKYDHYTRQSRTWQTRSQDGLLRSRDTMACRRGRDA